MTMEVTKFGGLPVLTRKPVQDVENNEVGRAARDHPGASDVGGVRHREQEEVSSHLQSCG